MLIRYQSPAALPAASEPAAQPFSPATLAMCRTSLTAANAIRALDTGRARIVSATLWSSERPPGVLVRAAIWASKAARSAGGSWAAIARAARWASMAARSPSTATSMRNFETLPATVSMLSGLKPAFCSSSRVWASEKIARLCWSWRTDCCASANASPPAAAFSCSSWTCLRSKSAVTRWFRLAASWRYSATAASTLPPWRAMRSASAVRTLFDSAMARTSRSTASLPAGNSTPPSFTALSRVRVWYFASYTAFSAPVNPLRTDSLRNFCSAAAEPKASRAVGSGGGGQPLRAYSSRTETRCGWPFSHTTVMPELYCW